MSANVEFDYKETGIFLLVKNERGEKPRNVIRITRNSIQRKQLEKTIKTGYFDFLNMRTLDLSKYMSAHNADGTVQTFKNVLFIQVIMDAVLEMTLESVYAGDLVLENLKLIKLEANLIYERIFP